MLETKKSEDDAIILEFKVHDAEEEETLRDTVAPMLSAKYICNNHVDVVLA